MDLTKFVKLMIVPIFFMGIGCGSDHVSDENKSSQISFNRDDGALLTAESRRPRPIVISEPNPNGYPYPYPYPNPNPYPYPYPYPYPGNPGNGGPIIEQFQATPEQVRPGNPVILSWRFAVATTVTIDGVIGPVNQSQGSVTVFPTITTVYRLTAQNAFGVTERQVRVRVEKSPGLPSIQVFEPASLTVGIGESTFLRWIVTGCSRVEIDSPATGVVSRDCIVGQDVLPVTLQESTSFEIRLFNSLEQIIASGFTRIDVVAKPKTPRFNSLTSSAENNEIEAGSWILLYWNVSDASRVYFDSDPSFENNPAINNLPLFGEIQVRPQTDTTYVLYAEGENGGAIISQTIRIRVRQTPRIAYFKASPSTIEQGEETSLTWDSKNCSRVTLTPNVGATASCSGQLSVSPKQTTNYQLTIFGSQGGTDTASFTVAVNQPPSRASIQDFSVSKFRVLGGENVTLSWQTQDARKIEIAGLALDPDRIPKSGQIEVGPIQTKVNLQLRVFGTSLTSPDAVSDLTIEVTPPPPLITSFFADRTTINEGEAVQLSWTAEHCAYVSVGGGDWNANDCRRGSASFSPKETTTYNLVIVGLNGERTDSTVTVQVVKPKTNEELLDMLLDHMINGGG